MRCKSKWHCILGFYAYCTLRAGHKRRHTDRYRVWTWGR